MQEGKKLGGHKLKSLPGGEPLSSEGKKKRERGTYRGKPYHKNPPISGQGRSKGYNFKSEKCREKKTAVSSTGKKVEGDPEHQEDQKESCSHNDRCGPGTVGRTPLG